MNLKLTDKTALVSGSTKGIGFAIASGLAREGARVVVNGRSEKGVAEAKQQITQAVPEARIEGFAGDLSTAAATETLLQQFPLRPIRCDEQLDRAIQIIDSLLDRPNLDEGEQDYLEVLSDLVHAYEAEVQTTTIAQAKQSRTMTSLPALASQFRWLNFEIVELRIDEPRIDVRLAPASIGSAA